jgi:hypothetical protein
VVTVRVSDEQMKRWQAAADADHRKLPDWMLLYRDAAIDAPPTPVIGKATKRNGR